MFGRLVLLISFVALCSATDALGSCALPLTEEVHHEESHEFTVYGKVNKDYGNFALQEHGNNRVGFAVHIDYLKNVTFIAQQTLNGTWRLGTEKKTNYDNGDELELHFKNYVLTIKNKKNDTTEKYELVPVKPYKGRAAAFLHAQGGFQVQSIVYNNKTLCNGTEPRNVTVEPIVAEKCELPLRSNISRLEVGSQLVLVGEPIGNKFQLELNAIDGDVALRLIFDYANNQLQTETVDTGSLEHDSKKVHEATKSLRKAPIVVLNIRIQLTHFEITIENNVFLVPHLSPFLVINSIQVTGDVHIRTLDIDGKGVCSNKCVDVEKIVDVPDTSKNISCRVPLVQPLSLCKVKKNIISVIGKIEDKAEKVTVILGTTDKHTESLHLEFNIASGTLSAFSQQYGIKSHKRVEKVKLSESIDLVISVVNDGYKISLDGNVLFTFKNIVKVTAVDKILVNGDIQLSHLLIDGKHACSPCKNAETNIDEFPTQRPTVSEEPKGASKHT